MKRLVIFCGGYTTINITLYFVLHYWQERDVTIVLPGTLLDLLKFFKTINDRVFQGKINLVHFGSYKPRRARTDSRLKKLFFLPPDITGERRLLKKSFNKYFTNLSGADVYFSGKGFGTNAYYILSRLRKANRLVYIYAPSEILPIEEYVPTNLTDLADLMVNKLIYGWGIVMGRLPYVHYPCIPDKFLKGVAETIDHERRNKMLSTFDTSRFKDALATCYNYRVIYFHQDLEDLRYVPDNEIFKKEIGAIFNLLSKYFPEKEVGIKYHPNRSRTSKWIPFGEAIEDYIPGEYLYNERVQLYLGIFSCALANVERGTAVSIIDLLTLRDDETRKQLKDELLRMNRSEILFPKTLKGFEEILASLRHQ